MIHYVKYVIAVGEYTGLEISGKLTKSDIGNMQRDGKVIFEYISAPIPA